MAIILYRIDILVCDTYDPVGRFIGVFCLLKNASSLLLPCSYGTVTFVPYLFVIVPVQPDKNCLFNEKRRTNWFS